MAHPCCNLVGNFPIGELEGIISVSSKGSTEMSKIGDVIIKGPSTGTLSISAYASKEVHSGCAGRAGLSLNWIKKYDCEEDKVYFIFAGEGRSYKVGDVGSLVLLNYPGDAVSYEVISASASSGPATVYQKENQIDSYGLQYLGGPWAFNTASGDVVISLGSLSAGYGRIYLQSFSINLTPNQIPVVNYDFVYAVDRV